MARVHDLIKQLRASQPELGAEIAREVEALSQRRAFGLNFERHTPEAVELPHRRVRAGDTVRVLPPRGEILKAADERLWKVISLEGAAERRTAHLAALRPSDETEEKTVLVADVVVVAEFREPVYPGLESTGKVERGGDKPYHAVINAENYHALQALLFTHRGAVDAIYIDPPYNTGARDWKYNNDYVEGDDMYRHSKWLAFMERRLLLAKDLLDPENSVLIVTIDEKEYLRLGLLLEQVFPEARIQMVSSVIKPGGVARSGAFARSDEYLYFVMLGDAAPAALALTSEWAGTVSGRSSRGSVHWNQLYRRGADGVRANSPGCYYPIYIEQTASGARVTSVGDALAADALRPEPNADVIAVWPPDRPNGAEGRWSTTPTRLRELVARGFVRCGRFKGGGTPVYFLSKGEREKVDSGEYEYRGLDENGVAILDDSAASARFVPTTQWNIPAHDASRNGSNLNANLLGRRHFPYPKSLFAVEDALRFFLSSRKASLVVDFFAGSGTTAHAVMRLNKQDGGRRRSISITNNEVSAEEQATLRRAGLRPGDPDWEKRGICDHITKPRVKAAITGRTPADEPISGDYTFNDVFPMSDGLEENVEFFTLTYETPMRVQSHREFARIAPLLWLRAGSRGRRIDALPEGWDVADAYGVLADIDRSDRFLEAMAANPRARIAFIVTDEDRIFEAISHALPEDVETIRLYDAYLRNFEIDAMRGVR